MLDAFFVHEVKLRPITGRDRTGKPTVAALEEAEDLRAMVEQLTMTQRAASVRGNMSIQDVSDSVFYLPIDEASRVEEGAVIHAYGKNYMVTGPAILRDSVTSGLSHVKLDTKPYREA